MRSLSDFEGAWQIARAVEDFTGGPLVRLDGTARFITGDGGLWLHEVGEMRIGDAAPMQAERRYFWQANGAQIDTYFDDMRPFHSFDPAQDAPAAHHDCAPDAYDVAYDFGDWPQWQARWRVRGPRKDYQMITRYWR